MPPKAASRPRPFPSQRQSRPWAQSRLVHGPCCLVVPACKLTMGLDAFPEECGNARICFRLIGQATHLNFIKWLQLRSSIPKPHPEQCEPPPPRRIYRRVSRHAANSKTTGRSKPRMQRRQPPAPSKPRTQFSIGSVRGAQRVDIRFPFLYGVLSRPGALWHDQPHDRRRREIPALLDRHNSKLRRRDPILKGYRSASLKRAPG